MKHAILAGLIILIAAFLMAIEGHEFHNYGEDANCLDCHESTMAGAHKHFFDDAEGCFFCHQVEVVGKDTIMQTSDIGSCGGCHINTISFGVEGPHSNLTCVVCHSPHSSDYANLLLMGSTQLCSESCHTDEQLGRSHPIGPGIADPNTGGDMTCTSTCHSSHKPGAEFYLAVASPDICHSCHGEKF